MRWIGFCQNFDIIQLKYHKLICETDILLSFIEILIKAQSETSILPSFIEISMKAQSNTSKNARNHVNINKTIKSLKLDLLEFIKLKLNIGLSMR